MAISTEMYYLQELPRYASEKPYTMRYTPEGEIPVSNVLREKREVEVHNMREYQAGYQVETNGFTVCMLDTKMEYELFDSHEKITTLYFRELEKILSKQFPGSTAEFVSYLIRKREASFPYSTGEQYSYGQPNIVAHIDATPEDLARQIIRRHGREKAQRILKGRAQYITMWKPLQGPLHDYPLALCDKASVDSEKDLEPQDIVDRGEVLENVHIYYRPRHRWYYLDGQLDSEVLVFRQADTRPREFGIPHCAISNPKAPANCLPRESIEVVAFVYSDS